MTTDFENSDQPLTLIELRPMDFGDILDGTIRVYRKSPWVFFGILASIIGVPVFITQVAQRHLTTLKEITDNFESLVMGTGADILALLFTPDTMMALIVIFIANFLNFFLLPISQGATVYGVSEVILGRGISVGGCLRTVLPRAGRIILAYMLYGLIIFMIFMPFWLFMILLASGSDLVLLMVVLFLMFPVFFTLMMFFYVKCLFIPHAVMLDDVGPVDALKRSFGLTSGYWWRTFAIIMIIGLIVSVIVALLSGAVSLVDFVAPLMFKNMSTFILYLVTGAVASFFTLLINPVTWIASTLIYYDLRIRREGFDLILLAGALSETAGDKNDYTADAPIG